MARRRHMSGDLEAPLPISGVSFSEDHDAGERPETPLPNYEGAVIGIRDNAIVGWVWDSNQPYAPIDVELYVGDVLVGQGSADKFDIELAKANRGNGAHQFELRLDRVPTTPPPFTIRAVISGSETELYPALTINRLDEVERLVSGSEYIGQVTGIESGSVTGWIYNRRNPHEQPTVTLRDGSTEILTTTVFEQTLMTIDVGNTASVYRFQLPLPQNVTDGRLHIISVCVGTSGRELNGSPVLFGASDATSLSKSLASLFEKIGNLERRIEALQPAWDFVQFEAHLLKKMQEPVDMLLSVHRDSIDREMSVLRRMLTRLVEHTPGIEKDFIPPLKDMPAVQDVSLPSASEFNIINRAAPVVKFDLMTRTSQARPIGGLTWSRLDRQGVILVGAGAIELEVPTLTKASIALRGSGASDISEFSAIVMGFNGKPLSGRFDADDAGNWSFLGTTIGESSETPTVKGLTVKYLPDIARPSGKLTLTEIAVFAPGRAPAHVDHSAPASAILDLGNDMTGAGWYPAEEGLRGGICWMGARSEVTLSLRQTGSYRIFIPEIRPLTPDIMPHLQIFLDGECVDIQISPSSDDESLFSIEGSCLVPDSGHEQRTLRLAFPKEYAKSPMELGLNEDQRPLTIAVRCIALTAVET